MSTNDRYDLSPFTVDGIEFTPAFEGPSSARSFVVTKSHGMIEYYRRLAEEFAGGNIVELGIWRGGSVALLALLARPAKLVSLDITPTELDELRQFLADRGLQDSVRPHYGVDQGDTARLQDILATEFGDGPLDLVADDASHLYAPTVASFDVLFPRLRPGGAYVIEDWDGDHHIGESLLNDGGDPSGWTSGADSFQSMGRIVVELMLARSSPGDVIRSVEIAEHFVTVRRGEEPIEGTFSLATSYVDPYGLLRDASSQA